MDAGVPWSRGWGRVRTRNAEFWRLRGEGQEAGAPHERGVAPDWETRLGGYGVPANATHDNQNLATVACQSLELESEPRDFASLVSATGAGAQELRGSELELKN